MSDGMGRELAYLSSHATNRYFIPNWGINLSIYQSFVKKILFLFCQEFRLFAPHALKGQKLLAQGSALGYDGRKLIAL